MASEPAAAAARVTREMVDTWADTWYKQGKPKPDPRGPSPGINFYYDFDAQDWKYLAPNTRIKKIVPASAYLQAFRADLEEVDVGF